MNNDLGKTLKTARGGKSLREFAHEIGISHTHLDSLERGCDPRTGKRVNVSIATLQKLSNATGINVSVLLKKAEVETE